MLVVDLIAGAVIAGAVLWGLRQGFAGALPVAAFAAGAVLGTRVPLLVGEELRSSSALLLALPAALVTGALLAALVERLRGRLRRRRPRSRGRAALMASAVAGGLLVGSLGVVAVWILGPVATEVSSVRDHVEDSSVLARLNSVLEPAGPGPKGGAVPADQIPRFAFARPDVAAPDARIKRDPDVKRTFRSVVKVGVLTCGDAGVGTGWIVRDGIVVTNAHVIRRTQAIRVRRRGTGRRLAATPIWFDKRNDLALLRVPELRGVAPLRMVRRARSGTRAAIVGFPGAKRRIRVARLGPTSSRLEGKIDTPLPGFATQIYGRLVTTFRGKARPGNSGGPLVDQRGRVLATVSAGSNIGQIGVPNRFVRRALRKAGPAVRTGTCPEGVL